MAVVISTYSHIAKRFALSFVDQILDASGKLVDLTEIEPPRILIEGEYNCGAIEGHFSRVLSHLRGNRELRGQIERFSPCVHDPQMAELISITIGLEGNTLCERDIKWAVLSALFTPLRQSVGSCFATAPAILVHEEQPHLFLRDLQDLLVKGRLSRTFGGVEYTVPISPSPGLGDLKRPYFPGHPAFAPLNIPMPPKGHLRGHPTFLKLIEEQIDPALQRGAKLQFVSFSDHLLLKVWEFTLASFVDVKTEFSRWNLYASLGLQPEEAGGIGAVIYGSLEKRLEEVNEELRRQQIEVEIAADQVEATESLMRNASSEQEMRRFKGEHQRRMYHLRSCEQMRSYLADTAKHISEFFAFIVEKMIEHFPDYFQEIYDAEMQDIEAHSYDDAPAGFRLIYKHGRTHVGAWTFIGDSQAYIEALQHFFIAIEHTLIHECTWEKGKSEIGPIITAIVHHIRTDDFLESTFYRMAKAHGTPLQKGPLETIEKKPWAYTSGGTVETLIKTYFCREAPLSEEARWVESPQDLCIFLLETLKRLPPHILDPYLKSPQKRMLATSPTHAFSILPGISLFAEGWQDRGFTYTWVRDRILLPQRDFYDGIRLCVQDQLYLVQRLAESMPPQDAHQLKSYFHPTEAWKRLEVFCHHLPPIPGLASFLFEMLPLVPPERAATLIEKHKLDVQIPQLPIGRRPFHDLLAAKSSHEETARLFQDEGLAPPLPLRFADSNWEKFDFAFIVSPISRELELWRTDTIGLTGAPMCEWNALLNGSVRKPWSVLLRPYEYVG